MQTTVGLYEDGDAEKYAIYFFSVVWVPIGSKTTVFESERLLRLTKQCQKRVFHEKLGLE